MRKPRGFWKRPEVTEVLGAYRQARDVADAVRKLRSLLPRGFDQSHEELAEDVKWYANKLSREQKITYQSLSSAGLPDVERVTVGEGGRLVIPVSYREVLGVREGSEVVMSLSDGELKIRTLDEALRRARMLLRRYVPEGRSLAEELIEERRREARRE